MKKKVKTIYGWSEVEKRKKKAVVEFLRFYNYLRQNYVSNRKKWYENVVGKENRTIFVSTPFGNNLKIYVKNNHVFGFFNFVLFIFFHEIGVNLRSYFPYTLYLFLNKNIYFSPFFDLNWKKTIILLANIVF